MLAFKNIFKSVFYVHFKKLGTPSAYFLHKGKIVPIVRWVRQKMATDYLNSLGVGSGLNTLELVSALVDAERAPKQSSIDRRASDVEIQISGMAQLKSALQGLQTAFSGLNDAREFNFLTVNNGNTDAVAVSATSAASAGTHLINVSQLAQRDIYVSDAQSSRTTDLNAGLAASFSFQVGTGSLQTINLAAGDVTLDNLADEINDLEVGVTAKVIQADSGDYRLFLESDETGTDYAITITDDLFGLFNNQVQAPQDAILSYNGVSITRASNQISDLIEGVTLNLKDTSLSSFTVDVVQDNTLAKERITSLVTAFNDFNTVMSALTAVETDDAEGGLLSGDRIVRDIQNQARSIFIDEGSSSGENIERMSDMGISIDRYGVFQIDDALLTDALTDHYDEVKSFFTADTNNQTTFSPAAKGLSGDLLAQLDEYLKFDGTVARRELTNAKTAAGLLNEEKELDAAMVSVEERYTKRFTAMNRAIAEMNSLKDYLENQLKNLPFTSGNK